MFTGGLPVHVATTEVTRGVFSFLINEFYHVMLLYSKQVKVDLYTNRNIMFRYLKHRSTCVHFCVDRFFNGVQVKKQKQAYGT